MRALVYDLSIPKYILSKIYFSILKGRRPFLPNLKYRQKVSPPQLPAPDWVVLKSLMSGICGSDQNMLRGQESFSMEPFASFPCVLGHENVAEIIDLGSAVTGWSRGDRVVVNPTMSCVVHGRPLCPQCRSGRTGVCEGFGEQTDGLGAGLSLGYHRQTGGGWGENFVAHQSQLFRVAPEIPLKRAVLTDPLACALQPVGDYALGKNEPRTVLIFGMGAMGLLMLTAIRALRLDWKIIAVYKHDFQGRLAKRFGADHIMQASRNLIKDVARTTNAKVMPTSLGPPVLAGGVDVAFDCVASSRSIDLALRFAKQRGRVVVVGTSTSLSGVDPTPLWFKEVSLVGSSMSSQIVDPRDGKLKPTYSIATDLLLELPAMGFMIEELVTHEYGIEQYKTALLVAMEKDRYGAVKVAFSH